MTALTTSCRRAPLAERDKELTLLIKLPPIHSSRAIEDGSTQEAYTVDTYSPITLFFHNEEGDIVEPYRVVLKAGDIAQAMGSGYPVRVRSIVRKVSAVCNAEPRRPEELNELYIRDLQKLESKPGGFLHNVPYIAEPEPVTEVGDKLVVTLHPKPIVARLEISGDITIPYESQKEVADWIVENKMKVYPSEGYSYTAQPCELPIHYIKDFTIRGIYVNNYKNQLTPASVRLKSLPEDYNTLHRSWERHDEMMHTTFGPLIPTGMTKAPDDDYDYAYKMQGGKVDAYQIFSGSATDPEALDHIVVEVQYDLVTRTGYFDAMVYNPTVNGGKGDYVYACSRVESTGDKYERIRRFITIRKFLVGEGAAEQPLYAFEAGKIYRIDLKWLSPLFSMNTNPGIKSTDEIIEITPRRERTDERPEEETAAVRVDVSGWTHININTELE